MQEEPKVINIGELELIHLQIIVRSSNVGAEIRKVELEDLFQESGKLDEDKGRNEAIGNLGLSVSKQIIQLIGGSVEVKSKVGRGTDFIINIKTKSTVTKVDADAIKEKIYEAMPEEINDQQNPAMKKYLKLMESELDQADIKSHVKLKRN